MLEPLLLRQTFMSGNTTMIKLGENNVPWDDNFRCAAWESDFISHFSRPHWCTRQSSGRQYTICHPKSFHTARMRRAAQIPLSRKRPILVEVWGGVRNIFVECKDRNPALFFGAFFVRTSTS